MSTSEFNPSQKDGRANLVLAGLAFFYMLLQLIPSLIGEYGYFIDEFYYIACSNHLAFGYVDHPPLSILLLRAVRAAIGDSLPALRIIPSLAGAATILVTGVIARRMGANGFGQALAAGAAMVGSIYHVTFSMYSMNALAVLMWAIAFWILVEIERRNEPRLWLAFGLLAGLALENKHTFSLLLIALAVGLVVTPARRHLAGRWLWLGLAIAVVLFSPNLLWQMDNGWPSLEFYRNADIYKNVPTPPLEVLKQQALYMNPAATAVWLAGLVFFLATAQGRRYRHLGCVYMVLLAIMLIGQKSRPDRIANVYTVLFAGGGVLLGAIAQRSGWRWLRWVLPATLIAAGVALVPLGLPLMPPQLTSDYASALGIVPRIEKGEGKKAELPQWLADRCGWEQLVDDVELVAARISPEQRKRAAILAPSYGQAGAIELLGRGRNLPPVYAPQNSYFHWGPPPDSVEVAIIIGPFGEDMVRAFFEEYELAGTHDCNWCMPWRDEVPIWLARRPKVPFSVAWQGLKHYE